MSRLLLINFVLDPFLYTLSRKQCRDIVKRWLCCCCSSPSRRRYKYLSSWHRYTFVWTYQCISTFQGYPAVDFPKLIITQLVLFRYSKEFCKQRFDSNCIGLSAWKPLCVVILNTFYLSFHCEICFLVLLCPYKNGICI